MCLFAIGIEHPLNVTVQRPHDAEAPARGSIVGPPVSATRISASMAACHSGAECSAFDSFVM